ncbi:MAG: hypothetical protein V2J10_09515 [Wenzhouxiangella sp.]|nr:hypothetical protein [Wenzhouxiangella sp.]
MDKTLTLASAVLLAAVIWAVSPGATSPVMAGPNGYHDDHYRYGDRFDHHRGHRRGGHLGDRYDNRCGNRHALARWYADRAHHQTIRAARLGCGFSGPRWRIDWSGHYGWAYRNKPAKLRREVERRARGLAQCRREIGHHRNRYWSEIRP